MNVLICGNKRVVDNQVRFGFDALRLHVIEDVELELGEVVVVVIGVPSPRRPPTPPSIRLQAPRPFHPSDQLVLRRRDPRKVSSSNNAQTPAIDTIFRNRGYPPDFDLANAPFGCGNRSSECTSNIDSDASRHKCQRREHISRGRRHRFVWESIERIGRVRVGFELELAARLGQPRRVC